MEKPFHDIHITTTGITSSQISTNINKIILSLGGTLSKDLRPNINILIVDLSNTDNDVTKSQKFNYSIKHRFDIIFLDYQSLVTIHQLWLRGDDISMSDHSNFASLKNTKQRMLAVLRSRYSIKPLQNYIIFIGRLSTEAAAHLPIIQPSFKELCIELGAEKVNTSYFPRDCNQLLKTPYSKIIFIADSLHGERIKAARLQSIPLVHYKWILDCNKRGAPIPFDPSYLLDNPTVLQSDFKSIAANICDWSSSTHSSSYTISSSLQSTRPITLKKDKNVKRLYQNALAREVSSPITSPHLPQQTTLATSPSSNPTFNSDPSLLTHPRRENNLFENCHFFIHNSFNSKQSKILSKIILNNNGNIITSHNAFDKDEKFNFIIIPFNLPFNQINLPSMSHTNFITEFFIERCLHYKNFIFPIDCWSKPLFHTLEFHLLSNPNIMHNGSSLTIAITGFQGVELLHLTKLLNLLTSHPTNINFQTVLNKNTDLLIANLSVFKSIKNNRNLKPWQNKYKSLFIDDNLSNSRNSISTESLKKKIEFVRDIHKIPVISPAFIINLLEKTFELKEPSNLLYSCIINPDWCIYCSSGNVDDYKVKLQLNDISLSALTSTSTSSSQQQSYKSQSWKELHPISTLPTIKQTGRELIEKFIQSPTTATTTKQSLKIIHNSSSNIIETPNIIYSAERKRLPSYSADQLRQNISTTPDLSYTNTNIKRTKITLSKDQTIISRSSSWGRMMENDSMTTSLPLSNNGDDNFTNSFKISNNLNNDDHLPHTQITYGISPTKRVNDETSKLKRLTRHQIKELRKDFKK
ncbi:hypothetical protein TBLA_0D05430 [Henningerozyma blattae CBS 6284]|uniref:BRCT domain-containing protein n=1 Tax=Henningerozyma blattae (strain ATCC 34711 / CBS 6284 / DSM 70876 / NBRC 10599 / NRRL Y-10934 / UCD 77-7) TaxID=1071380 RepID=I2H3T4_HENB6|nr:hypothetical protein TBLA_0D05430 [Tetrapisispora blattae CBS 6284]CCH61036.1 hypothetical protein TBLA_0D05430 [Tetrapisispora blattae CBS 6284]